MKLSSILSSVRSKYIIDSKTLPMMTTPPFLRSCLLFLLSVAVLPAFAQTEPIPTGTTLFQLLSPDESGIRFANALVDVQQILARGRR